MSNIPDEIEGLGKATMRLRHNPAFEAQIYEFSSDSYFVWSRIDGYTSVREVILMVGLPVEQTIAILRDLRASGALLVPGEVPESVAELVERTRQAARSRSLGDAGSAPGSPRTPRPSTIQGSGAPSPSPARARRASTIQAPGAPEPPPPSSRARRASTVPPGASIVRRAITADPVAQVEAVRAAPAMPDELTDEEAAAMAAEVDIPEATRRLIIAVRRQIGRTDYFALLGESRDADKRQLKRAYFRLSKEFHPDRFFGKKTGPFEPWLGVIFESLSKAFDVLGDDKSRERYLAALAGDAPRPRSEQTPAEHARELFDRACGAEMGGDPAGALRLFAAAIHVDAQTRYISRAARCAIAAGELSVAEEYAKKAAELKPESASLSRILADAYRAAGKLAEAEATLVFALSLSNHNDVLANELSTDLAEVRAQLAAAGGS